MTSPKWVISIRIKSVVVNYAISEANYSPQFPRRRRVCVVGRPDRPAVGVIKWKFFTKICSAIRLTSG